MSLQLLVYPGLAGLLFFVAVSLGNKAEPKWESPIVAIARTTAVTLAGIMFLLYVAEASGLGPSPDAVFRWLANRAQQFVDARVSALWSA